MSKSKPANNEYFGEYKVIIAQECHPVFGNCIKETWTMHKVKHRLDEAAVIYKDIHTKEPFRHEWFYMGNRHRDNDESAIIDNFGEDELRIWYRNGWIHRDGSPAKTYTTGSGRVIEEEFYNHGKPYHPEGGAVHIVRDRITGRTLKQEYAVQTETHSPEI